MSYIINKVFENESINYILDSFLSKIDSRIIGLGGKVAENIYAGVIVALKNIVLVTNDAEIMSFCRLQKDFFNANQVFHYKDRSIYYTDLFCLEIWYDENTTFNTNLLDNVSLQDRDYLNPETLNY